MIPITVAKNATIKISTCHGATEPCGNRLDHVADLAGQNAP